MNQSTKRLTKRLVDETTLLIVISTVAQTIVLSITLLVFVLQFRSQVAAIRESSYQGLIDRYNDMISKLVENPRIALSLFSSAGMAFEAAQNVTNEDAGIYGLLLLAYGIIEEAFLMYQRKWISEEDWHQWSSFLERLSKHPMFPVIHKITSGTFDERFENYVSNLVKKENRTTD